MKLTKRGKTVKKITEWALGIIATFLSVTNADHVNASTILVIVCVFLLLGSLQVTLSNIQSESETPIFDQVGKDLHIDISPELAEYNRLINGGETA